MSTENLHMDGNALAGVLAELFGEDVSATPRRCAGCRELHMVGEHMLYESAGYVLRCPGCGDLAATIVARTDGYAVTLRGTWLLTREV
jgi:ribosomal protein S27E